MTNQDPKKRPSLESNNVEWQLSGDGDFEVSDKQLPKLNIFSELELFLNSKAKEYLDQVDGSLLSSRYITEKSSDIDTSYEVSDDGDIEPTKPADKGAEEEVEDDTSESKEAS